MREYLLTRLLKYEEDGYTPLCANHVLFSFLKFPFKTMNTQIFPVFVEYTRNIVEYTRNIF